MMDDKSGDDTTTSIQQKINFSLGNSKAIDINVIIQVEDLTICYSELFLPV
jgi:hypothetical protein